MTHPAPGFLISWVLGGSNEQNTGNKKSSPWMSYFPVVGWSKTQEIEFLFPGFWAGAKHREISNPAPGFLISCVLGRPKTNKIRNPAPGFLISCVFGPASGGKKKPGNKNSSPWISYFLCSWSKSISNLNPPPIAFGRIPKLSPICCRNPKPVHWGFRQVLGL